MAGSGSGEVGLSAGCSRGRVGVQGPRVWPPVWPRPSSKQGEGEPGVRRGEQERRRLPLQLPPNGWRHQLKTTLLSARHTIILTDICSRMKVKCTGIIHKLEQKTRYYEAWYDLRSSHPS